MNKAIFLSFAVLAILFTSCISTKQLSRQQAASINWAEYNTFKFGKVSYDSVPAVIGESIVQEIEEGIRVRFDAKGIAVRDSADLLVNLHFSFGNPDFIDANDMNVVMKSLKYTASWSSKLNGYYKDGIVKMDVVNAQTGETIWSSTAKGFVNADGSDVARGTFLGKMPSVVSGALFKGFPQTGKPSITSVKRKEAKAREKAMKKLYYGN